MSAVESQTWARLGGAHSWGLPSLSAPSPWISSCTATLAARPLAPRSIAQSEPSQKKDTPSTPPAPRVNRLVNVVPHTDSSNGFCPS